MVYADAQQASAADGSSSDDDVVDADYESLTTIPTTNDVPA